MVDTNYQHAIAWHRALREAGAARVLESIGELREDRGALAEIAR